MQTVSAQTLRRLPTYLNYLKRVQSEGRETISAKAIAEALGLGEIQVRKDIAAASSGGKPKIGYGVRELILELEAYLGYNDANDAVLVGAGKLGSALLSYQGFKDYGLNIVAGFDIGVPEGKKEGGKPIFPVEKLPSVCKRLGIKMGIITVPASEAQGVCDMMVECGIEAIWSFAPTHLIVPEGILVRNENMAFSLAMLSKHLKEKMLSDVK
ncbi:MAG: redox-sensing transcriptional repressor Rex [Firmicutes bacterium]|nr:redox-sensing transcriptional repressor Rex [Bacillota bacterium]